MKRKERKKKEEKKGGGGGGGEERYTYKQTGSEPSSPSLFYSLVCSGIIAGHAVCLYSLKEKATMCSTVQPLRTRLSCSALKDKAVMCSTVHMVTSAEGCVLLFSP